MKDNKQGQEKYNIPEKSRLEKIAAAAFALLVWQAGAMLLNNSMLLAAPLTVVKRLYSLCMEGDLFSVAGYSLIRIVSGFLLALAAGGILAVIAARFRLAEVMIWPFIAAIKSVPVASFIILCLIWLNSGTLSIFIAFLMVIPVVYTNMLQGIKSTDSKMLEMAEVFSVSWLKRIKYIYLPQLKPYILSACSVSIGLSWKAGTAAEVIGIPEGSIGEMLYEAKVYFSSGDLLAWTVVIIAASIAFEKLFLLLLRYSFERLERS
ncbi:MAG TPA: ABC transporter permease subunit [Clostridiales bacterium]|nr:ABC transporter permease subunit [Clostridiales bacterium]